MKNMKTFEELNWPEKWKFGKNKGTTQQVPLPELNPERIKEKEIDQKLNPYGLQIFYSDRRDHNGERHLSVYTTDNSPIFYAGISDFDDVDYAIVSYRKKDEQQTNVRKKVANIDAAIDYIIQIKENEGTEERRRAREYTQESVKIETATKKFEELNWPEKWKFGKNKGTTQQQVPQNVQPDVKKQKENEINQKLKPYRLYATCPYDRNDIGEEKIYVYYGSIDNYNGMFDDNDDVWYATISTFDDVDYAIVRYNENGEENKPIRKKVADIDAALDYLILMKKNLDANMRRRAREYTHESVKIKNVRGLNEGSGDMAACSCNSKKKKNKSVKKMLKKMKWENL